MGAKPKVTVEVYAKIKRELKTPKDDAKAMKKYKLGKSTIIAIRRSNSYVMYRNRLAMYQSKKKTAKVEEAPAAQERAQLAWQWFMGIALVACAAALFFIVRWVLSLFGV